MCDRKIQVIGIDDPAVDIGRMIGGRIMRHFLRAVM